jgi:tripartite-type tricarboxylate transporter receptor subunit TctC
VAVTHVATAKPDGYTLGATPSSSNTVAPFLLELSVDPVKDITPILSFANCIIRMAFFVVRPRVVRNPIWK